MAASQSELLQKSHRYEALVKENFSRTYIKTAFLCHSHKDDELAKGLQVALKDEGIQLYIDWQDQSMPETPNAETANKIKDKIRKCDVFLYLATQNANASRWCPWEIGNADSSNKKIFIIPTADGSYTYGNEYLQLYPHFDIVYSENRQRRGFAVFSSNQGGKWLKESLFNI